MICLHCYRKHTDDTETLKQCEPCERRSNAYSAREDQYIAERDHYIAEMKMWKELSKEWRSKASAWYWENEALKKENKELKETLADEIQYREEIQRGVRAI